MQSNKIVLILQVNSGLPCPAVVNGRYYQQPPTVVIVIVIIIIIIIMIFTVT